MSKLIKLLAVVAILAIPAVVVVGLYTTWSECKAAGGVTLRGLVWLECIK